MYFTSVARGIYEVESNGEFYRTDTECKTCTCAGFYYTGYCKHLKFLGVGIYDRVKGITKEEINQLSKPERHALLTNRRDWLEKQRKKDRKEIENEQRRIYTLLNVKKLITKQMTINKEFRLRYEVHIRKDGEIKEYLYSAKM
jgi:hypothetical protein